MTDLAVGTRAVRLAREAVEFGLASRIRVPDLASRFRTVELPDWFEARRGVFVTWTVPPTGRLRGCVGFPLPIIALRVGIPRAAWAAARDDPRFPPVAADEFSHLVAELSVLTVPERLSEGRGRAEEVVPGRDGLIVEADGGSGLLLPQVAVEQGWGPERFLSETCRKAGLPADAWRDVGTTVRRFQAELFRERTPAGPVEAHTLERPPSADPPGGPTRG